MFIMSKSMKYVLFFMLLLTISWLPVYGDSAKIKNPSNNHWYQRFDTPMSWLEAKAYCESLGGHLATITSEEENDFIYLNLVVDLLNLMPECWLGATDEENESIWTWVTGETWNYTNWAYGEPNNWPWPGNEDHLAMFTAVSKWNDSNGNYMNPTICEWEEEQTITLTSPNGGEKLDVASSHAITWKTTGNVGNVKIEYSISNGSSWKIVTSSTTNDGSYNWTIPNTISNICKVKTSEASDEIPSDTSDRVFSIVPVPEIRLSHSKLNFCSLTSGISTIPRDISITNSGSGTLNWHISVDSSWLLCAPGTGTGNGTILVSVNSSGLTLGTYTGKVIVSDPNAINSPQSISITLKVKSQSQYTGPFGEFSTPVDGSTVRSSIPVTGWALDDIGIQSLKIYREDGDHLVLIGDAIFIEGARPDVETAYPDYPFNYKAGWGYMLLTNFLPNGGNGIFKLHAIATGGDGKTVDLGVKTITVDNAHAVKPFGAIDTPAQGGTASGDSFINWGWVLTPHPNNIPTDGSTIGVWIDGVYIEHPVYNNYRQDIASLLPGYSNSNGAGGYYQLDTTAYPNGIHTINWTATDSDGNIDGIGSRYFTIQNSGNLKAQSSDENITNSNDIINSIPIQFSEPVMFNRGFRSDDEFEELLPDENGLSRLIIKELERMEIKLGENYTAIRGYLMSGDKLNNLPIGSTLDRGCATFSWSPGPGFLGHYSLVFILTDSNGQIFKKSIEIEIEPKFK